MTPPSDFYTQQTSPLSGVRAQAGNASGSEMPNRSGAEHYDSLLCRLCTRMEEASGGYLVGLTSCSNQPNADSVAMKLAIRAADHRILPVLLVNASPDDAEILQRLEAKAGPGLADVLAGQTAFADSVQSTGIPGLDLLPYGGGRLSGGARIDLKRTRAMVDQLRERYALVVCNLPEAREMNHSLLLARALDAVLLIVRSEHVARQQAESAMVRLTTDGVHVVGAVMTDRREFLPDWIKRWI